MAGRVVHRPAGMPDEGCYFPRFAGILRPDGQLGPVSAFFPAEPLAFSVCSPGVPMLLGDPAFAPSPGAIMSFKRVFA